ncbi:MAG: sodium:solute symporter, partial [Planctomycetota bacterium]
VKDAGINEFDPQILPKTLIGLPSKGAQSDLTYLAANIGAFMAIAVVALVLIPAYYRQRVTTVYGLLGQRYGAAAAWTGGAAFLLGRLLGSGARLFIAGGAVAFLLSPSIESSMPLMVGAIVVMVLLALLLMAVGGMRSVIWTDVCQAGIFILAAVVVIGVLLWRIPLETAEIFHHLHRPGEGEPSKLRVFDPGFTTLDPTASYSLLAIILGLSLINLGAYGTDQDMTQRLLTCRDAKSGARSAVMAVLLAIPVTTLFMAVGMLLWIFYDRPDLMGSAGPDYDPSGNQFIFAVFIARELPMGLAGLLAAGLVAAAVSGLTSEINAMGATAMSDCYRPLVRGRSPEHYRLVLRLCVLAAGIGLAATAVICIQWQRMEAGDLIDFALGVMTFCYSGLVAVFVCAVALPGRGTNGSAVAAILTGFVAVCLMRFVPLNYLGLVSGPEPVLMSAGLAFPYQMAVATGLAMLVCMARPARHRLQVPADAA